MKLQRTFILTFSGMMKMVSQKIEKKSGLFAGQLKVTMDNQEFVYSAYSISGLGNTMEAVFNREGEPPSKNGVQIRTLTENYGKEVIIPNGSTWLILSVEGVPYTSATGKLTFNCDDECYSAHGSFSIQMPSGSPYVNLTDGIFSINPF
ncbi:hypothetical protein [Pseudomonas sp. Ant30-3]|uniref:hypothetical protein n=1 Tax=Pseudomonas sp. Ant30-3 TaxID=1488328 RepID=UPI0004918865|nr:hypothetical protein [Pseudomonas sp. Ant30-3]